MGRKKQIIPTREKVVSIPTPLLDKIELLLFSDLEGRIPQGAWQQFCIQAFRDKLKKDYGVEA